MPISQHLAAYVPTADGVQMVGVLVALTAMAVGLVGVLAWPRAMGLRATEVGNALGQPDGSKVEVGRLRVNVRCKLVADVMLYKEDGSIEMLLEDAAEHEARDLFQSLTGAPWTATLATNGPWTQRLPERARGRRGVTVPFKRLSRSTRAA